MEFFAFLFERMDRLKIAIPMMFLVFSLSADAFRENAFTRIYESIPWDEDGFPASGSQFDITKEYVAFLQNFLQENEIRTVVDLGCGDWAFSKHIDWGGIQYTGIDIVKFVVQRNERLFGKQNIRFIHADAIETDLPEADLLICKDVFQHLPNQDIFAILKQKRKFKHCLFTDFIGLERSIVNNDIRTGSYHFIDLSKPPFSLEGKEIFRFSTGIHKSTFYIKRPEAQ